MNKGVTMVLGDDDVLCMCQVWARLLSRDANTRRGSWRALEGVSILPEARRIRRTLRRMNVQDRETVVAWLRISIARARKQGHWRNVGTWEGWGT